MNKLISITLVSLVISLAIASCGSSKKMKRTKCDAYSNVNYNHESDLASK